MLGAAITSDLNNAYDAAASPWRLTLFESPQEGHFLALGYRHVIADARSVVVPNFARSNCRLRS